MGAEGESNLRLRQTEKREEPEVEKERLKKWEVETNRGYLPGSPRETGNVGGPQAEETGESRDKENRRGCGGGVRTETEKQTGEKLGGRA